MDDATDLSDLSIQNRSSHGLSEEAKRPLSDEAVWFESPGWEPQACHRTVL